MDKDKVLHYAVVVNFLDRLKNDGSIKRTKVICHAKRDGKLAPVASADHDGTKNLTDGFRHIPGC